MCLGNFLDNHGIIFKSNLFISPILLWPLCNFLDNHGIIIYI